MNTYGKLARAIAVAIGLSAGAQQALAVTNLIACGEISVPGSYQLTKDLVASSNCIFISASNVTLDLRGHTISGTGTTGPLFQGISSSNSADNVHIRNGTITNFPKDVHLRGSGAHVEGMRSFRNGIGLQVEQGGFLITGN